MVRVFLKGGVWKNSEDEILKAAVQKYGKQQWARVASLLNRKTAKQAKARWQEWLDPSIRKVEWTQQEEQQLLYLAKLLPAQWKTIAPMIGRTAVQCQEHYEKILDDAAAAAAGSGGGTAGTDPTASLREQTASSLRPGQIDTHPENKPAKPDPIDMDEDEMEMLQEARARLANTQGKKAKRKQRERILNQAKRLADLQKRRELKQAGLLSSNARKKSSKRKNEIDFGVEIPFYKEAPTGFHDVSNEQQQNEMIRQQRLTKVNLQQVNENLYRTRDKETEQLKQREINRLRILEQSNEQYMKAAASTAGTNKKEDENEYNRLGMMYKQPMQLPAPTNDMDDDNDIDNDDVDSIYYPKSTTSRKRGVDDNDTTMTMISQYTKKSQKSGITAATTTTTRTIVQATSRSEMMEQARELRDMDRSYINPLLYDPHDSIEDDVRNDENDDDERKLPAKTDVSAAPPILSIRDLARQQKKAIKEAQMALQQALASLPVPQYEYDVALPEEEGGIQANDDIDYQMDVDPIMELDQADVEEQEREQRRLEAIKEYEKRSSVMKRPELPRPSMSICTASQLPHQIQLPSITSITTNGTESSTTATNQYSNECSLLVAKEVQALLYHDAVNFPVIDQNQVDDSGSSKKKKKRKAMEINDDANKAVQIPELVDISDDAILNAKKMIDDEYNTLLQEKINMVIDDGYATNTNDAIQFLTSINTSSTIDITTIECMRMEYDLLCKATNKMIKKNDKIVSKLQITNGGYIKRGDELSKQIQDIHSKVLDSHIEQYVYDTLQVQEEMGYKQRIQHLQSNIQSLRTIESQLQKQYNHLMIDKRRMDVLSSR